MIATLWANGVGGAGYRFDNAGQLVRIMRERVQIVAKYLAYHILPGSCHQFIEAHLYGILETNRKSRNRTQCFCHFF